MLSQSIDQLLPLLELISQPAFCLREDGTIRANRAAQHLAPIHGDGLPHWLGDSFPAFEAWDRSGNLELPICTAGHASTATVQPLADGLLFLLRDLPTEEITGSAMTVAAQVLRQPLTDLSAQMQKLTDTREDPELLDRTAAMQRQLFRINRITGNLTDLDLLQRDQYPLQTQRLDTTTLLTPLMEETAYLVEESGHSLTWSVPTNPVFLPGDKSLICRAILNLISNALKYSPAGTPIAVHAEATSDRLLVQVKNTCEEDGAAVLRGAFDRLHQRDLLPDPRWGVGLGLPLTLAIARAHGGTVALEHHDNTVTVTLSLSRKRSSDPLELRASDFSYDGGMRQTLVELADCLPNKVYHPDDL